MGGTIWLVGAACLLASLAERACGFVAPARALSRPADAARRERGVTALGAKAGKGKKKEEIDYSQFLDEEEREEGIWPTAPAPWETQLGVLEPLMLDADDFDEEDEFDFDAFGLDPDDAPYDASELEAEQDVELSVPSGMELPSTFDSEEASFESLLIERAVRFYEQHDTREREKCFLVGVAKKGRRTNKHANRVRREDDDDDSDPDMEFTVEESLTEVSELVGTAGLEVVGSTYQKVFDFNARTCIGSGKVREIKNLCQALGCKTVIIDEDLTPSQQTNLENSFGGEQAGIKVLDRTALILDIFAQHAKTREGKLQVELALMMYRLPRLTRLWTHLERQSSGGATGGVGLRGPGELQLEVDKRIIRKKIAVLKKELMQLHRHRSLHRVRREKTGYPVVALVGYTNSGKSTLLNGLTRAGALAEDLLFATLDPTTRKLSLPLFQGSFPHILLTDTVGFIQKLPTHLVAAFRATLEEIFMADVLVHVVDLANPLWRKQKASVDATLEDMGVGDKPRIVLYNKVDLLQDDDPALDAVPPSSEKELSVVGSAVTGLGQLELLQALDEALRSIMVPVEAVVPYSAMDVLSQIFDRGSCDKVVYQADGTFVAAQVPGDLATRLMQYRVDDGARAHKEREAGAEIDWAALAKGRHEYMEKVDRGEVAALTGA